jgi:hypothetical protein
LIGTTDDGPHSKVLEDVWQKTLAAVPSDFGKLVYLASLRDPNSGVYHHYGLEAVYSPDQCDVTLRRSHEELLYRWLEKTLEEQRDDLEFYLRGVEGDLPTVLRTWSALEPYRNYLPLQVDPAAAAWFESDLRIILDLLRASVREPGTPPTV